MEQLLAMIDDGDTTYDELKTFNYEIMLYIRDICNSMPGGTEMLLSCDRKKLCANC